MTVYSVKQARLLAEKSQVETAKMLGVHKQTYRKIEQNPETATIEQATKLAHYFNRKIDEICFFLP